jgi:hypothetical protein
MTTSMTLLWMSRNLRNLRCHVLAQAFYSPMRYEWPERTQGSHFVQKDPKEFGTMLFAIKGTLILWTPPPASQPPLSHGDNVATLLAQLHSQHAQARRGGGRNGPRGRA